MKSCVVDGELIATGHHVEPDFVALLHGRHVTTCAYCFDLLELNGRTFASCLSRSGRLQALLTWAKAT
jgi:ATP-dependent DNA ligase